MNQTRCMIAPERPGSGLVRIIACLSLLFAAPRLVGASETVYSNINCGVTYPPGWESVPVNRTNYVALVKSLDGKRSVIFQVRTVGAVRWSQVSEEFKQEGRRAYSKQGMLIWDRPVTISGQPGWEVAGRLSFQGKSVSSVERILIAGGKAYKVNTLFVGGDAESDAELQGCLHSFRLLHPPPPPQTLVSGPALSFLGVALPGVLLGLLVWGGVRLVRKQRLKQFKPSE